MSYAEAIEVGGQPKPRVVGAGRLQPLLGKEERETIDGGGEEVGPLAGVFRIQIGHFRQCDHFVLVAAAIGDDLVQRRDRARRIVVVALRENPAAQDVARRWAELVGGQGVGGELALGRDGIDAFYANRGLTPGGEQEPDYTEQSEGNVPCRRAFHSFGKVRRASVNDGAGGWRSVGTDTINFADGPACRDQVAKAAIARQSTWRGHTLANS